MIDDELKKAVADALEEIRLENQTVDLEHPAELSHGDYSTNIALVLAKLAGQKPHDMAKKIVEKLENFKSKPKTVENIEVAGPGFINFYLTKEFFGNEVANIGGEYGRNQKLLGKKVMVEYTDPNPFKEFHIGHLMSNAVGEAIARLVEFEGAKVVRACWQGDVGLHVAKAIWSMYQGECKDSQYFQPRMPGKNSSLSEKIKYLGAAYVYGSVKYVDESISGDNRAKKEINELNKKIFEQSDAEINKLYTWGRETSLKHFEGIYKILGTKFNHYFFEGKEGRDGQKIVEENIGKVFEKSEGAVVYHGERQGLHTRVFLTREGLPTYEAKELGLNQAKFKAEPDLDTSIIITANEQSEYFKVVLSAMNEVLPEIAKRTKHVAHGMLRFASGKMSSRKGNVITGEALIAQVTSMVHDKLKDREMSAKEKDVLAEIVAVGAIKYSILRQAIGGDIIFDFEKSISFEGDSGPYLQYSYVRAKSVLGRAVNENILANATLPSGWETITLEKLLVRFPEVVARAGEEYQPHYVTTYLTELAGVFNGWYAGGKIIDVDDPTSPYKLALTKAFAEVMKNGLWLLGIKAPEKM